METFALLFDLDGTLVDTDTLHINAYNLLLADWQRSIDVDYYKANIMGFPNNIILKGLFPELPESEHAAIADRKESLFRGQVTSLTPMQEQ